VPGTYAMQAYDAAMLIDSGVKAVKADLSNKDAVAAAWKKANFASLRGGFKFSANGYPSRISNLTKVAKRRTGNSRPRSSRGVRELWDRYARDCTAGK